MSDTNALLTMPIGAAMARGCGPDASTETVDVMSALLAAMENGATVREMASALNLPMMTLLSRFRRAGLPSPTTILRMLRLAYVARLFDAGLRTDVVVAAAGFRSPQGLGRYLRQHRGMTLVEFRERCPCNGELTRIEALLSPHFEVWRIFRPITGTRITTQ